MNTYLAEFESWLITIAAQIAGDFALDVIVGIGVLASTGNLTTAAVTAIFLASFRVLVKTFWKILIENIKKLRTPQD